MDYSLDNFVRKHDKVICIDSDGTMIDAMNVKHDKCHGQSFIETWGLQDHAKEIHEIWDSINLYEKSRGINRFLALREMFKRINGTYLDVDQEQFDKFSAWVDKGSLSNAALEEELKVNPTPLLEKIHAWSLDLNKRIASLTPTDKPPYPNGKEALEYALGKADIAIISSSNMAAIVEEWKAHDLIKYVDVITSQEVGTKGECLARMLTKGYSKEDILMIGDAYPDVDASNENGVWYYPILTRHEGESWQAFINQYFDAFLEGRYNECQQELMERFEKNFDSSK
ncbi:MAG: HAD hydrolase-like protein [Solobacterium sp.]|nr:HAD hydrolase-like protein [Solobacterium sp.]